MYTCGLVYIWGICMHVYIIDKVKTPVEEGAAVMVKIFDLIFLFQEFIVRPCSGSKSIRRFFYCLALSVSHTSRQKACACLKLMRFLGSAFVETRST